MKVSQETPQFTPVTITLESVEELRALYTLLNYSGYIASPNPAKAYTGDIHTRCEAFSMHLFQQLRDHAAPYGGLFK